MNSNQAFFLPFLIFAVVVGLAAAVVVTQAANRLDATGLNIDSGGLTVNPGNATIQGTLQTGGGANLATTFGTPIGLTVQYGRVGIGTANPTNTNNTVLHVAGNTYVNGEVSIGSSIAPGRQLYVVGSVYLPGTVDVGTLTTNGLTTNGLTANGDVQFRAVEGSYISTGFGYQGCGVRILKSNTSEIPYRMICSGYGGYSSPARVYNTAYGDCGLYYATCPWSSSYDKSINLNTCNFATQLRNILPVGNIVLDNGSGACTYSDAIQVYTKLPHAVGTIF